MHNLINTDHAFTGVNLHKGKYWEARFSFRMVTAYKKKMLNMLFLGGKVEGQNLYQIMSPKIGKDGQLQFCGLEVVVENIMGKIHSYEFSHAFFTNDNLRDKINHGLKKSPSHELNISYRFYPKQ